MRIPTGSLCLALATMLCIAMPAGAQAATAPQPAAAQQPIEEVQELDEIWVRGKYLSEEIVDAEDDFFKLYNKVNKKSAYDVFCGTMSLSEGSMIMIRKCVPGFIVYNSYDPFSNTVSLGSYCSGMPGSLTLNRDTLYMSGCANSGYAGAVGYQAPPAALLLMERGPDYARNVVKVVSSDPRLVTMANNLMRLYNELELTQHHYAKVKTANTPVPPPRPARTTVRRNAGPRVL